MEIAVVLVILLGLGFVGMLGAGFIWLLGSMSREEKARARAEANAPALLDETFDGSPDVVVKVGLATMKLETVILGAKARGYRLLSKADEPGMRSTLVFTRD